MLQPGTVIAGYRIVGALGRGGMGSVYEAVQVSLDRTVALKILRDDLNADEAFRARFRREGRVQARLSHPHIVGVHEAGEVDGLLYIAMQLVRGSTLKELITAGAVSAERAVVLLAQVADALDTAHAAGLIHRDVKPQNVLVGADDHAYLADFGLTKMPSDSGGFTRTGQFVGTYDYISPEQISGDPATPASDVYALGAVLYESLTGEVPFGRESEAAVLFAHVAADPPRLSEARDDLPVELDAVIARAMHKEPAQRPMSAGSVIEQARAALNAAGGVAPGGRAPRSPTVEPRPGRGGGAAAPPVVAKAATEMFPPTMEPGSRLIPPESDPGFSVPDLPPPVATTIRGGRRGRRRAHVIGTTAVAVAAVAVGLVAGLSGGDHDDTAATPPLIGSGTNAALAVRWPAAWAPARSAALGDALRLKDPIALSTTAGGGATFAAGLVRGTVTDGLLTTALESTPPKPERVRVNGLSAYRYENLELPGVRGGVTVVAAPTSAGVVTLVCAGPGADASGCDRIAATTTLRDGHALGLGPDAHYARGLRAAVLVLDGGRDEARTQLAHAAGPKRQATAADAAASAFTRADRAMAALKPGPAEASLQAAARSALARCAKDYTTLASAARHGSERSYRSALQSIHKDETAFNRALAAFSAAGYQVD